MFEVVTPESVRKEVFWEGLDEDAVVDPDEVHFRVFRDDDLTPADNLLVER